MLVKKLIGLLLVMLLVIGAHLASKEHEDVKKEFIAFMQAGDRNTGANGFDRDTQIAELDARVSNLEAGCLFGVHLTRADGKAICQAMKSILIKEKNLPGFCFEGSH